MYACLLLLQTSLLQFSRLSIRFYYTKQKGFYYDIGTYKKWNVRQSKNDKMVQNLLLPFCLYFCESALRLYLIRIVNNNIWLRTCLFWQKKIIRKCFCYKWKPGSGPSKVQYSSALNRDLFIFLYFFYTYPFLLTHYF